MVTGALPFGGGSKLEDTLDAIQTTEPKFPKHLSPLLLVRQRDRESELDRRNGGIVLCIHARM